MPSNVERIWLRRSGRLVLLVGVLALPAAAGAPSPSPSACVSDALVSPVASQDARAHPVGDLTVFAAASLAKPFADLEVPWEAAHPGSRLVFSFDASSALRAQIEQGAPADVLASADTTNPQALVDRCLAAGPISPFATNHLVIVVPAGNPAGIASPADLATPGIKVVAAGPDVPITRYATQLIDNLSRLDGYPADFTAAVAANVVSEEDNVKAVLAKIELGEGDAAIVYATDAASSSAVGTVAVPGEADVLATFAAAAITDAADPALASDFLAFLADQEVQAVFAGYGFLPPAAP